MQTRRESAPGAAAEARRSLPAVSRVLASRAFAPLVRRHAPQLVADLLRERLAELRDAAGGAKLAGPALRAACTPAALARDVAAAAAVLLAPRPRPVINATGIVVHTNLGRSLLSRAAAADLAATAQVYVDLEYDLAKGTRGSRGAHLDPLLARLFPGHASAALNNNAAAVLVGLRALARGREVVVSRGELVEIGGSFRIPDILAASGAHLHEVGTTNRTRLADYEAAISPRTALLLKVHPSNFRIVGFTEDTEVRALAGLGRRRGVPLLVDWGSGALVDLAPLGVGDETPVAKLLAAGADLVTFSADKLLGGPQAGLVVGRGELVARIKKDPLARVCRLDRLLVSALAATLGAYVRGTAETEVPTLRMLALDAREIDRRAQSVRAAALRSAGRAARNALEIVDGISKTGGGSSPLGERPTRLLAARLPDTDAAGLERRLRAGDPPLIGRLHEGRLLLDLRTVLPEQDRVVARRLGAALREETRRGTVRR